MTETVLVTGSAGFIGYHTVKRLLADGFKVVGLDALSNYYDVSLKEARHAQLTHERFIPVIGRVETPGLMMELFEAHNDGYVIHLAAQAGVRYSIENPRSYLESNINGTFEILEAARAHPPKGLFKLWGMNGTKFANVRTLNPCAELGIKGKVWHQTRLTAFRNIPSISIKVL